MTQSEIRLTVGIPTWNGAGSIAKTIESVLAQDVDGVEVVVSDNCSSDETTSVVQGFVERYPGRVRHVRNSENVGFDRNVDATVRRALGRFVWWCSDNDRLLPGSLARMVALLGEHPELGLVMANYESSLTLDFQETRVYASPDAFLEAARFKSGLISANVVRRDLYESLPMEQYFGTQWQHIGYMLEALRRAPAAIVPDIAIAKVHDLPPKWGHNGSFVFFGLSLVKMYRRMPALGYSRANTLKAIRSIKGGYLLNLPRAVAEGLKVDRAVLGQFIEAYRDFPSFWLVDLPLLLMPRFLYLPFYSLVRAYRRRSRES